MRPPARPRPASSSTNFNIIYSAGASSYPLANFSWALIYQKQANTNTGIVLGKLFQWVSTSGQSYSVGPGVRTPAPAAVNLAHSTLLGLQTATGSADIHELIRERRPGP